MAKSSVAPDLLKTLQIITKHNIELLGSSMFGGAILVVLLPVEHPCGDLVPLGLSDDHLQLLDLIGFQLTSPLAGVNFGLPARQACESTSHTTNGGESVPDLLLPLEVGVVHSDDVLEVISNHLNGGHGVSQWGHKSSFKWGQNGLMVLVMRFTPQIQMVLDVINPETPPSSVLRIAP